MDYRLATTTDLDALLRLEAAFAPQDRFSRRQWRRLLTGKSAVLVSCDDCEISGAAILLFRAGTSVARLYSLVVALTARGRGVARGLIETCTDIARSQRCDRLRLEVRASNIAAVKLYASSGFYDIATKPGYYPDGEMALQMEKRLTPTESPLT